MSTEEIQPIPNSHTDEQEPLLGRPGDSSQPDDAPIWPNLIIGTAPLAQIGVFLIAVLVWIAVLTHKVLLFAGHPLLNTIALIFALQAILILQPTHTPQQKRTGTLLHSALWAGSLTFFYASLIIIEVHKYKSSLAHFHSPHAIFGVVIYVLLTVQALVGLTQYFFPALYGSVDNAKSVYKYHRVSGYLIFGAVLVNIVLAGLTPYAGGVLGVKTWTMVVGVVLVAVGVVPRIMKQKFKFF